MNRNVPFFNYPALFAEREREIMETVRRVLASGKYILQDDLERFERELADFVGVKYAFGVGNGTDALLLALRASGIGAGDEVILPSHTFVATGSAVVHAGATPILVDVGDDHLIDPDSVRAAITPRTKAIVPVQLNGRVCDMDALQAIAKEHDLTIIEDAAQGLGAARRDRRAGSFGLAAGFSFYPAKLLGCFGDGGAVVTSNELIADRIATLRNHGRMENGLVREWSYNTRLDNLQAAILSIKLATFQRDVARRREIAARYHDRLASIEDLRLPPPPADREHFDVYQNYEVEAEARDDLQVHLAKHGIHTIVQWGGRAIHQLPNLGFTLSLPVTERVMAKSLLLPMNTSLSDSDVDYIGSTIESFYGARVIA